MPVYRPLTMGPPIADTKRFEQQLHQTPDRTVRQAKLTVFCGSVAVYDAIKSGLKEPTADSQ